MSLKKLLSCLAFGLLLTAPAAEAADVLELTFRRTGTAASSVTTTATGIDGVTATLKSASHQFKNSTASVTPTILCPDVNGNSSPTITLEFELTGLPSSFTVEDLNFDIHALNSGGAYQQSDDNKSRQFNVTAQFNGTTFGSLDDIDIAKNVNTSGAERHQVWTIQADEPATPSSPLTLKVTITKGTSNEGCFFGLSSIRFNTPEPEVRPFEPAAAIGQASSFYYIQSPDNQVLDNNMQWIAKRPDPAAKWYFVGTSNADGGYCGPGTAGKHRHKCTHSTRYHKKKRGIKHPYSILYQSGDNTAPHPSGCNHGNEQQQRNGRKYLRGAAAHTLTHSHFLTAARHHAQPQRHR